MDYKKEIYQRAIMLYGFCPLLILVQQHEENGEYEECKLILDTLLTHYNRLGIKVPTRFSEQALQDYVEAFWDFGLSGGTAKANVYGYASDIKEMLK